VARRVLAGPDMHAVTFEFKRAHWRSVAFGKKAVERVEHMTPARFDLMYHIRHAAKDPWTHRRSGTWVIQADLWKDLGVHHSTVSKMIKRLVQLGWLRNEERPLNDSRTKIVRLTALGVRRIERAMRLVFKVRTHLKFFEDHFKKRGKSGWQVLEEIDRLLWAVRDVARDLGDGSNVYYWFGYDAID
jgi:DNA-binding MarR family transcriptional regulator